MLSVCNLPNGAAGAADVLPDSQLVTVPGDRTFVPLEDPAAVAAAIGAFIAEHPVGAVAA